MRQLSFHFLHLRNSSKNNRFFYVCFADPAKILSVSSSAPRSWIGQTVTMKCVSDGVPTPTLTWYKPNGNEINTVTAKESTVEVMINYEHDFGEYKCAAYNGLDPSNKESMPLEQIRMFQHSHLFIYYLLFIYIFIYLFTYLFIYLFIY